MTELPSPNAMSQPRHAWLTQELLWLGVVLPAAAVVLDQFLLSKSLAGSNRAMMSAFTFGIFVIQIGILSSLVGSRVKLQPHWWGIFAWSILLVDLQVFALAGPGDSWTDPVHAFGFAFGSAQIGLSTCWGLLGKTKWTSRFPIAVIAFAISWFFCISLGTRGSWMSVLFLQCVATVLVCLVLRFFRFKIEDLDLLSEVQSPIAKQKMQFSIRHLFYWTTGVAVLVGVGRLIGLQVLVEITGWSNVTVYAPAFTMITVIAFWAALGSDSWLVRFPVLLVALPSVGGLLGLFEHWRRRGSSWGYQWMMPWNTSFSEKLTFWIIWASLAGMLLAAFVMVFRAGGQRLVRGGAPHKRP